MIAIIMYGPPGSGKGTQAKLLADKFGLIHFDTGKYIERVVHNSKNKKNKIIQKQRELFDSGILCDPSWVFKIVSEKTRQLVKIGFGIVFSGSPRTFYETFGIKHETDAKIKKNTKQTRKLTRGLIDILEKYYGKKNVFVFNIDISDKNSIKRNGNRLMCSVCGTQILNKVLKFKSLKVSKCPFCGGKLYRRTLDKPEIIKVRLKEYRERTLPIQKELKKRGYKIIDINGESLPEKVHKKISSYLT
ncbi:MAG: nucleoside monophosphate kinase [bacterium]|nr:nucleoside monophosphate kinase [bacterium]